MLNVYDYVRLFVFVIAACVLATRKTKIWFLVDILWFSMSMGVSMFLGIPSPAGMFSSKLDVLHKYLLQAIGCYTMVPAVLWFQCRKTHDSNIMRSIMLCRIMALGLSTLLDVINSYRFPKSFTVMHMYYTLGFGVLWLITSTVHLIRHGLPTLRREHKMPINWYLKLDLVVTAVVGCQDLFVQNIYNIWSVKVNDIHVHFVQLFGAYILVSCILSYMALGFRENNDKKAVIITKTLVNSTILLCFGFSCLYRGLTVSTSDVIISCVLFSLTMLPTIGLYIHRDRRTLVSGDGYYNLRSRKD